MIQEGKQAIAIYKSSSSWKSSDRLMFSKANKLTCERIVIGTPFQCQFAFSGSVRSVGSSQLWRAVRDPCDLSRWSLRKKRVAKVNTNPTLVLVWWFSFYIRDVVAY